MHTKIRVIENRIAVHANLIIRYDLLLLPTEAHSREKRVLINVCRDLIKDLICHVFGRPLSLLFILEKWKLVAQSRGKVYRSQPRLHEVPVKAISQNELVSKLDIKLSINF